MKSEVKKLILNKKLLFLLILFILLFSIIVILNFINNPKYEYAWFNKYPAQEYRLDICKITSPKGWNVSIKKNFNGNDHKGLLFMSTEMKCDILKKEGFQGLDIPFANLWFGFDRNESTYLKSPFGKFLKSCNSQRTIHMINERQVIIYRYEGNKFLRINEKEKYETIEGSIKTVTIGVCNEFGFYAAFWGLADHEKDFIYMLNSISWLHYGDN